jgi:hypothetical protein
MYLKIQPRFQEQTARLAPCIASPTYEPGRTLLTITAITGGLTLDVLDDNSSGFDEAFQPTITAPAHSKGYVEFSIQFVTAGTTTPQVQTEIPVTPIDVDGKNGNVYEFDEIYRYNASYVDYNME